MRSLSLSKLLPLFFCIMLAAMIVLPTIPISAQTSLSAAPGKAIFNNIQPGTLVEKTITIFNGESTQISAQAKKTGPQIFDWLSFPDGENFTIAGNGSYSLLINLAVPVGTPSGVYEGKVIVTAEPNPQDFTGGAGAEIAPGVMIDVIANVGGDIQPQFELPNDTITIESAQEGSPIKAQIDVSNTSSVALSPTIVVDIYDSQNQTLLKTYNLPPSSVPGNTTSKIDIEVPSDGLTEPNNYVMRVRISVAGTLIGELQGSFSITKSPPTSGGDGDQAGLAVTPGQLSFAGVLPGVSNQKQIQVSNLGAEDISVKYELSGPAAGWITVRPTSEISIPPKGQDSLTVTVRAPEGTSPGDFQARLLLSKVLAPAAVAGAGAQVVPSVEVPIQINVVSKSGTEARANIAASDLTVLSTNAGKPISMSIAIANIGNAEASPRVVIEILDTEQKQVLRTEQRDLGTVVPGQSAVVDLSVPSTGLAAPGNYWAKVSVYLGDQLVVELLETFDVVPADMPIAQACLGNFKAVLVPAFADIGDEIKIRALFENTSQIVLTARFVGRVEKGDKVFASLETPLVMILPGEQHELTTYFEPKEIL